MTLLDFGSDDVECGFDKVGEIFGAEGCGIGLVILEMLRLIVHHP